MASFRGLPLGGAVNFIFSFSFLHPHPKRLLILKGLSSPQSFQLAQLTATQPNLYIRNMSAEDVFEGAIGIG